MALTGKAARHLRGLAHHLDPVVLVGDAGVSDAVIAKVDAELENHELIKVRVSADRDAVAEGARVISEATGAEVAGRVGKVIVLYRPRRKGKRTIKLPE
jgi:RNA-binding protein